MSDRTPVPSPGRLPLVIVPDDDDGAGVFVDGAIDGRPRRFLLDTGAAGTSVVGDSRTDALPSVETSSAPGVFASAGADDIVTLPSLTLGPIARSDLRATRVRDAAGRPVVDLIGMNVLRDHDCLFRFSQSEVLIDPPAADRPAATRPLRLDMTDHPYVDVDLGGGLVVPTVWDTGASMTVVDSGLIRDHPELFTAVRESVGTDSAGRSMVSTVHRMAEVTIGGVRFAPHLVAAVDLGPINATIAWPMTMVLGYTTLAQADWWMGFRSREWAVLSRT